MKFLPYKTLKEEQIKPKASNNNKNNREKQKSMNLLKKRKIKENQYKQKLII